MDAKKLVKELRGVTEPKRVRVTLNLDGDVYQALCKLFPRHAKPSVSDVLSRLGREFLAELKGLK